MDSKGREPQHTNHSHGSHVPGQNPDGVEMGSYGVGSRERAVGVRTDRAAQASCWPPRYPVIAPA